MLLLKGILIGLTVSAPVGPVAVLCLRRTLQIGAAYGYASAAGAVAADMIFGIIACFGVAAVAAVLTEYSTPLRLVGGFLLLGMGISSWRSQSGDMTDAGQAALMKSFGASFALTITNPMTIFAFTGLLAASDIVSHDMSLDATLTVILGILLGVGLWWGGLVGVGIGLRRWLGQRDFRWLHHLSGALLLLFGVVTLLSVLVV
ncbi:LysE family translocator [Elstera litoralis]|uniref:LysE family translocator n=1 Tax=Elstera litoralis TaxID=552518 RepID=UPI0018DC6494|nr:LysE family transporter [Elstera litoralis]